MVGTLKRTGCEPSLAACVVVTDGVLAIPVPTRSGGSMSDGSWAAVMEPHAAKKSNTALFSSAQYCRM
jgi:hypothetical protein